MEPTAPGPSSELTQPQSQSLLRGSAPQPASWGVSILDPVSQHAGEEKTWPKGKGGIFVVGKQASMVDVPIVLGILLLWTILATVFFAPK